MAAAETIPTASPVEFVAVDQQVVNGAQVVTDKPFCVGGNEGNCVSFQLPKVRMVRVPRVTTDGQQGNSAKSGVTSSPGRPGSIRRIRSPKKRKGPRIVRLNAEICP
jgi:hypothetical protein